MRFERPFPLILLAGCLFAANARGQDEQARVLESDSRLLKVSASIAGAIHRGGGMLVAQCMTGAVVVPSSLEIDTPGKVEAWITSADAK